MSNPATIKAQMTYIQGIFGDLTQQEGGQWASFICSDLLHAWKILFDNSQAPKVLIVYNGETQRVNFPGGAITGRVDRRFKVIVSRGRSFQSADRGLPLYQDNQNARPLFDIVDEWRDACRALIFDPLWCERPVDYIGISPFSVEGTGAIVDAYCIDFQVGTQLGMIESGTESDQYVVTQT